MELESLRGTNEYLERNLAGELYHGLCVIKNSFLFSDVEKRYETEVNTYQGKLSKISNELEKDCFKAISRNQPTQIWLKTEFECILRYCINFETLEGN